MTKTMGKLTRNLRICGECGIVYTSVSFEKYIDECPICHSKRFEALSVESGTQ
jgi:predicted  nucleic acid-binding Zn-ribbon protein